MKTGPKTKPIADVEAILTDGQATPATAVELKAAGLPVSPKWMSDATIHEYKVTFSVLQQRRVFTRGDCMAFLNMFRHYEAALHAQQVMMEHGLMATDERGLPRKTPVAQIYKDNSLAFLRYAVEFGLTPSSRTRQGGDRQSQDDDEMERLLSGR